MVEAELEPWSLTSTTLFFPLETHISNTHNQNSKVIWECLNSITKSYKNSKYYQNNLLLQFTWLPDIHHTLIHKRLWNLQRDCLHKKAHHSRCITNSGILLRILLNLSSLPRVVCNFSLNKIHNQSFSSLLLAMSLLGVLSFPGSSTQTLCRPNPSGLGPLLLDCAHRNLVPPSPA